MSGSRPFLTPARSVLSPSRFSSASREIVGGDRSRRRSRRAARDAGARPRPSCPCRGASSIARAPEPRRVDRQPGARRAMSVSATASAVARQPPVARRELGGQHDAGGDRFAVQHVSVAEPGLDRVPEGMSEVEERTAALFAFILGDDRGLDLAGAPDRVSERFRLAREQRFDPLSSQAKNAPSAINAALTISASPARSSRSGSVRERIGVGDDRRGLVECADQVLAARVIDAGLAADRRIDLREQRGRQLHDRRRRAGRTPPRSPRCRRSPRRRARAPCSRD